MLHEITITDLGVIEEAVLSLDPGLTVLTGETGAGKTMVVTGLTLLLGSRADSGLVRTGAARSRVEGILTLPVDHPGMQRAEQAGADVGDELIVVRTVSAEGRSRAVLGGAAVPVGVLAEIADLTVAVHGQADQWRLRRPEEQRDMLDAYGGEGTGAARAAYEEAHEAYERARGELADLTAQAAARADELDLLTLGLERIERVNPEPHEDHDLRVEDERLSHAEELRAAAAVCAAALAGDPELADAAPDVLGLLATSRSALAGPSALDPELAALADRVAELTHLVADLAHDVSGYAAGVDLDPVRLAWVQERRAAIAALTRQYGADADEVRVWAERAAGRVAELGASDERIAALTAQTAELEQRRARAAERLTAARTAAAGALADAVGAELAHLAMGSARLEVVVRPSGRYAAHGADEVEFLLAANPGSPPRELAKAASGGELSRLMLALELVLTRSVRSVPTLIFDEVDAGVGGRAALDLGARLARLADHAQVVVVTHLAQVAAHADRHLLVTKSADGNITRSGVSEVAGEERVAELARMMAGTDSAAALEHARDLLASVARDPEAPSAGR